MSRNTVFCIVAARDRADRIVHNLKEAEFTSAEVSVLFRDPDASGGRATGRKGSLAAGAIRGVMGWIAGGGRVVIPGIDPLIAAGPIAAVLSGATVGGVAGGLVDFGLPSAEAGRYEGRIKEGAYLIAIQLENPDRRDRAREIVAAEGAEDICTLTNVSKPAPEMRSVYRLLRGTAV